MDLVADATRNKGTPRRRWIDNILKERKEVKLGKIDLRVRIKWKKLAKTIDSVLGG